MAAADKKKLDGIQSAANKYTLPVASTATLGGVKPDGTTITIGPDGTITQDDELVGRLSVVRFATLGALEKGGDGLYRNASNMAAMDATDARIRQGMLEGSNVNPILEITNLIEIQRAYESVSRMIENANDLSRRSVERLGRVG